MKLFTGALVLCLLQVYGAQGSISDNSAILGQLFSCPCQLTDKPTKDAAVALIQASAKDRADYVAGIDCLIRSFNLDIDISDKYGDDLFQLICDMSNEVLNLKDYPILDILNIESGAECQECEAKAASLAKPGVASYCLSVGKCYIKVRATVKRGEFVDNRCATKLGAGVIAWNATDIPTCCTIPFSGITTWTQRIAKSGTCNYVPIDSMGVQGTFGSIGCGARKILANTQGPHIICDYPLDG